LGRCSVSPAIEAIILQIIATSLRITSQGQWHVHVCLNAHVRLLDVYVLPATTRHRKGEHPERALEQAVYWENAPGYSWQNTAQAEARNLSELEALLADLEPFLAGNAEGAA